MMENMKISDSELENVSGGWGHANGTFVNYGSYIVYTVAGGDVLGGIALRFGVTVKQLATWNQIKNVNLIYAGQKLTIYPTIVR